VLGSLVLLLAGYLYGGWRARAEENLIRQEAVARFVDLDIARIALGLESELDSMQKRMATISESLAKIPPPGEKLTAEQLKESSVRFAAIEHNLKLSNEDIRRARALSQAERAIYSRIVALKINELRSMMEVASAMQQQRKTGAKKSAPANNSAKAPPGNAPAESPPSLKAGEKHAAQPSTQEQPAASSPEAEKKD
jgi:hypothetical protein